MTPEKHTSEEPPKHGNHHFGWRNDKKNYYWRGTYHVTITVKERRWQPLGRIAGDASKPDGDPQAPHVVLTAVGKMVEHELTTSISKHYSMLEVQDYVIMPDHLHFIIVAHRDIVSSNGRPTHLGQVIAGFKKGCNRSYWEITGQTAENGQENGLQGGRENGLQGGRENGQGKPALAGTNTVTEPAAATGAGATGSAEATGAGATGSAETTGAAAKSEGRLAVVHPQLQHPQHSRPPSTGTTGRPPLFAYGYVDVMPLQPGQLEQQRQYIRNNPRYRLLRTNNRTTLQPLRGGIDTAVTLPALKHYLQQECYSKQFNEETWLHIQKRLLVSGRRIETETSPNEQTVYVDCDSYGDRRLLKERLLPVVCHRDDIRMGLFPKQKEQCLAAAANGAVLVSARIAKGEQEIIDEASNKAYPVITIEDNGLPEIYHPSERRMNLCNDKRLLIVTPWLYEYRPVSKQITVAECKTMNCIAQALCRLKDTWWKTTMMLVGSILLLTACSHQQATTEGLFHPMDIGREVSVSCFEVDPNGSVWMGLDGYGLAHRESSNAPFFYYNKVSGTLPSDVVICIYRTASGRLWCGSFGNGLFYWDGEAFVLPDNEQLKGKNMEYIAGFAEDKSGRLWIATQKAGLACCETTDSVVFYNQDNSPLATNWLADIKTFDRQTLFIATGWGLFTINTENGHIEPLQDSEGKAFLENQLIRILYPAPDGWLWIGTATGLYAWHKDLHTVHHLTTEDGLGDNLVKAIAQDLHGNIWVTGDHSITRVVVQKQDQDIAIEDCQAFSPGNGIGEGSFHVRAIGRLTDGRMLFGHSKGCLTINPHDIPVSTSVVEWPWVVNIVVLSVLILLAIVAWRRKKMKMMHAPIEPSTLEITSVDQQLKEKAIRIVEEHISESEFSVEDLSAALGMSRGHLYKRLVAITGKTPIEFIRTIRIKRGRQLLEESGEGVQQVAWRIGMSPKQFAKYFKEEYGVLPSDFKRNKP